MSGSFSKTYLIIISGRRKNPFNCVVNVNQGGDEWIFNLEIESDSKLQLCKLYVQIELRGLLTGSVRWDLLPVTSI